MNPEKTQMKKAVLALAEYVSKKKKGTAELVDCGDNVIQLQFGLKKIPFAKNKLIKVLLPNSLVTSTTDVCLLVKDLEKRKSDPSESKEHFTDLLFQHKIKVVSEVIPLKTIKTEYKPYEAKKNLSNMYDIYLADARIVRLLPALLGKNFYGRKRYPIQVNLQAKDLKKEISKAVSTTQFVISGRGSSCLVTVGKTEQDAEKVVENIMAVINKLTDVLPGGSENVKNMHIKTKDSPSLTVYWSSKPADNVKLPERKRKFEFIEPEDVTTVMHGKVRVTPYGSVHVVNAENENDHKKAQQKKKEQKQVKNRKKRKLTQVKQANVEKTFVKKVNTVISKTGKGENNKPKNITKNVRKANRKILGKKLQKKTLEKKSKTKSTREKDVSKQKNMK